MWATGGSRQSCKGSFTSVQSQLKVFAEAKDENTTRIEKKKKTSAKKLPSSISYQKDTNLSTCLNLYMHMQPYPKGKRKSLKGWCLALLNPYWSARWIRPRWRTQPSNGYEEDGRKRWRKWWEMMGGGVSKVSLKEEKQVEKVQKWKKCKWRWRGERRGSEGDWQKIGAKEKY